MPDLELLKLFFIQHTEYTAAIAFIFGLCFGSFLNVVIYRIPNGLSLSGRSMCPKCLSTIRWYDNIPVFSYILLQARCRKCKAHISAKYPSIELLTAYIFGCCFAISPETGFIHSFAWSLNLVAIGWAEQLYTLSSARLT